MDLAIGKSVNKPLLASVFIAFAAPTATMAAPMATVHAALIAVDTLHGIAVKKVRAKPKPMPAPKALMIRAILRAQIFPRVLRRRLQAAVEQYPKVRIRLRNRAVVMEESQPIA